MTYINPSIGKIGEITHDVTNDRVKYFSTKIHEDSHSLDEEKVSCLDLMASTGATRFTGRFLTTTRYTKDEEATIQLEGNFNDVHLVYLGVNDESRKTPHTIKTQEEKMISEIRRKGALQVRKPHPDYLFESLHEGNYDARDIDELQTLYAVEFPQYMTTLDSSAIEAMVKNSVVGVARTKSRQIVSASVGEISSIETALGPLRICELSEMATLQSHSGKGLVTNVTRQLIQDISGKIDLLYGEARAPHAAINWAFAKLGFEYAGTLEKACIISGRKEVEEVGPYENLNVWARALNHKR